MMRSWAIVDLETTGLNPQTDRIIEIGCMIVSNGVPGPAESILVNPERELAPVITEITGLTQKDVDGAQTMAFALGWLGRRLWTPEIARPLGIGESLGHPLVIGHNFLAFDMPFLCEEADRNGIALDDDDWEIRDTAVLFIARQLGMAPFIDESFRMFAQRVMMRRPRTMKYNLRLACETMGVRVDDVTQHRAAGDITLTQRLYEALMAVAPEPVERPRREAVRY